MAATISVSLQPSATALQCTTLDGGMLWFSIAVKNYKLSKIGPFKSHWGARKVDSISLGTKEHFEAQVFSKKKLGIWD